MSLIAATAVSCSSANWWVQESSSSISRTEPAAIFNRVQVSLVLQRWRGKTVSVTGSEQLTTATPSWSQVRLVAVAIAIRDSAMTMPSSHSLEEQAISRHVAALRQQRD